MKNLIQQPFSPRTNFIGRVPEGPEQSEQMQGAEVQAPVDHAAVAREGMREANAQIRHIGTLSPEAGQIVGQELPRLVSGGIDSADQAAALGAAAAQAREEITRQMNADPESDENNPEVTPEAYQEVMDYFTEIEAQMAAAQAVLQEQVEANPDNEYLADQLESFEGMMTEVSRLRTDASEDLSVLQQRAAEGGVTGPLAQRLAAVAQDEVGQATSDAEGNAKYTPGGTDQPWCADFVNYCLEEAGGQGTGSSMAKSFTAESGSGHVAVVVDDSGATVGGNEGDAVSDEGHVDRFEKVISAEDVSAGNFEDTRSVTEAKAGDIAVKSRETGDAAPAADQQEA
ncbi:hypothetical protein GW756_05060 [bacterium]|nr:hypothetical protein [bacterium]NCQ55747.1 hypothetical protein [Candidatus Parcubacteria bacterium]NCS67696.1 hypothetical protein [Candidatus Peregrinibacteria bacterium]NCS96710.1 hypothetical protein [bacterium]